MQNTAQIVEDTASPQARGKRLKIVRTVAHLTREDMEVKYRISASTIQSWEAAKAGGLTKQGAERVIPIFRQEGISCSAEWLLYGIGNPPQPSYIALYETEGFRTPKSTQPEEEIIAQELQAFRTIHKEVIDLIIPDDGMGPQYQPGDLVAGKRRSKEDLHKLIGYNCIVQTIHNDTFLRRVKPGLTPGRFNLQCINPDTHVAMPTLYDQELVAGATVIWHRRRCPKIVLSTPAAEKSTETCC